MKTERDLALEFFNVTEVSKCGYRALVGRKWEFITDLIVNYRKAIKTKRNSKLNLEKKKYEFNLKREELLSEVENRCIDLFKSFEDIVVFINKSSVNIYDPITGSTVYCLLAYSGNCIDVSSNKLELETIVKTAKRSGLNVARSKDSCLVNGLKEAIDVAEASYNILTKLRYE